jgi:5-methylcytosine-specific restriction enzyme subunit McrC
MQIQINLFEHVKCFYNELEAFKDWDGIQRNSFIADLEFTLNNIWKNRKKFILNNNNFFSKSKEQNIIDIGHKSIKAINLIGTFSFKSCGHDIIINILPKIFYQPKHIYSQEELFAIQAHVLWWLSECQEINLSTFNTTMSERNIDFLEIFISVFARFTLDILSSTSYNYYELVEENTIAVKGKIDFRKYTTNIANGNIQKLFCSFDNLQNDNLFNQIIKNVSAFLLIKTKSKETRKSLEEILFILDDVEDKPVTLYDCEKIVLNPIFTEYKTILDYCKLFLSNTASFNNGKNYDVFSFLVQSEKLFEKFIYSQLKSKEKIEFQEVKPSYKRIFALKKELGNVSPLNMFNDIVLDYFNGSSIILDCKYKLINDLNKSQSDFENRYNVSQADIYQMASYAIRSRIDIIGLIYPKVLDDPSDFGLKFHYEIDDEFTVEPQKRTIKIKPFKVNIIHEDGFSLKLKGNLNANFKNTKDRIVSDLLKHLEDLLALNNNG